MCMGVADEYGESSGLHEDYMLGGEVSLLGNKM